MKLLLNAEAVELNQNYQPPKGTPVIHSELGELYLPLEGHVDKTAEIARLKKELEKYEGEIAKVEQKLNNPNFTSRAPAAVLAEHQQRLADWKAKRDKVKGSLDALGA
jgi:valyl-tRNA synthetase